MRAAGSRPRVLMCLLAGAPLGLSVVTAWGCPRGLPPSGRQRSRLTRARLRAVARGRFSGCRSFYFRRALINKCLLLSGALPPLTPARVAPAGGRCFSWYLCGLWPCVGNFAPELVAPSSDTGATAKPRAR